ncbi:MAG: alanine--tRNA ligase [Candidatus Woesearchaeota archaeon]|jgi:alanyl-tRNA synthetase|nr:alanine--tRNA ligase [Candidatus Woesearchaeota archaeon]MDP7623152.1 alanine--tRNA ligase [Candidatus Woesearchaeota archaeon]HJN56779.1 alanine--tRNA ligase [Candidatus Woesearchaeota archaeon]|tara:strand:- start:3912 stop:5663 length:1752 start_codon:yes stop_codon:yes gene_type:complete
MNAKELKKKYFEFFKGKNHAFISSASLIPEHDPTVLFTTAGMHPLVPYFIGETHPAGKRLVNVQKCIRTGDIDEVGDPSHLTFFEMLGNWSLGDYWKKEAINWSYEFLTDKKWLGIDKNKLSFTCFKGDKDAPKDEESAKIWESLEIPKERIYFLPKEDNWWGPAGETGPCGPCTEMFYDTGKEKCSKDCKPGCSCGKYFEIWNDVFLEYDKKADGSFKTLKQKTVDTGMGVERAAAMLQGKKIVYDTEMFAPIIGKIKDNAKNQNKKSIEIIADHLKASTFILAEKITPSNLDQGYILRRLIRKSIRHFRLLGIEKENFTSEIAKIVIQTYKDSYSELNENKSFILDELKKEEEKFKRTLETGLREFNKLAKGEKITGKQAFILFSSYGFPIEMTEELAKEKNIELNKKEFEKEFEKHQELSRKGAEKRFKGGLSDSSEQSKKLHTATHLLNAALRIVLKNNNIIQKGSNITSERLRFDFNFDRKLTKEELKQIEDLVNEKIKESIPVKKEEMTLEEAKKRDAQGVFEDKYKQKVSVYTIGDFSVEICGGPHVNNTNELGNFKIKKEESSAAGIRRIKAVFK